jgi:hypothetical protein
MRYFSIILFTILISSCCRNKGIEVIQDKSWFPYKMKSNIGYETKNGLIDSLSVAYLDTSNQWNHGDFCAGGYEEYRVCTLNSNKFNDFQLQVSLDPFELGFMIDYSGKVINLHYCTTCNNQSTNPSEVNHVDSISFNNVTYRDLVILSDSINDFEIYYNRLGILRYIINKDTFDLKR